MTPSNFLGLACCAAALLFAPARAAPLTVRIAAQESIPPKWLLRAGRAEGLCPDILAAVEQAEPRLRFRGMGEARSLPYIEKALEAGLLDAACALVDTARRRAIAQPSQDPMYIARQRLAAVADDPADIRSIADLVRLNPLVNTPRGAAYADELRQAGVRVDDSTGDNVVNLRKILAGHGRFTYINELTLAWLVRDEGLQSKIKLTEVVLHSDPLYFWIGNKTDPETAHLLQEALHRLAVNGTLERIYQRWAAPVP